MPSHRLSRLVASIGFFVPLVIVLLSLVASGPAAAAGGPNITIGDKTVTEGNSGTVSATFTISLDVADPVNATTITYATADNTAVAPNDYTAIALGTATIPAGSLSTSITISVKGDTLNEIDETFFVNLTGNPSGNATILDGQAIGTILNDDALPKINISDYSATENIASTSGASFVVSLSAASGQSVSVTYATSNGTATSGVDYIASPATVLTFAPGEVSKPISVAVIDDALDENNETFNVNLTNPVNATIQDNKGVATIINDDQPPTISISDQQLIEGNSGTVNMPFTVSLSAPSGKTVTVKYQTASSTATSPADFTAIGLTTLTFQPGTQSLNVNVAIKGDTLAEGNETFTVNLSAPTNATLAKSQGVGTIQDDDAQPTISIGDITVAEPANGVANATFTISLSAASGQSVSVSYATADGTATAGFDYQAQSGSAIIAPGTTTKQLIVPINSDQLVEPNETFFVNLSNPINATLAKSQGVGTITSTGGVPTASIGNASVLEANGVSALFTVSLSAASNQSVTISYAVSGGTALAGSDFQIPATTALIFPAGSTAQTIAVPIIDDPLDENDETFSVTLTGSSGATLGTSVATGTIIDNDPPPTMTIGDVKVSDSGNTPNAIFTVSLSAPSSKPISVNFQTANGTASAGVDYLAQSGTLNIPAGATSATIAIPIITDSVTEPDETFTVNLGNAINATLGKASGTGTISDKPQSAPQSTLYLPLLRR